MACLHPAPTIFSRARGFAIKGDCGDRRRCPAARERWRREMRERLNGVAYSDAPVLWTLTARTRERDALFQARRSIARARRNGSTLHQSMRGADGPEKLAPFCEWMAWDRGDARSRADNLDFSLACSRLVRAVERQWARQQKAGYARTRHARKLIREYETAYVLGGRRGASFKLRIKEAGEGGGRMHAHAVADFRFVHHGWFADHARLCGLGFVQFSQGENARLRQLVAMSLPHARAASIALYLSKYLTKPAGADGDAWPWPSHTRLLNAGQGVLPARVPAGDCAISFACVASVAVDILGAVECDWNATSWFAPRAPADRGPPAVNARRI
jgi:hypothetical protein